MNAKEAREYAQKLLTKVDGKNKDVFDEILLSIQYSIDSDPTRTYITCSDVPKQVIAWLESKDYGYETCPYQLGPNESGLKISWAEEGIKMYGNDR